MWLAASTRRPEGPSCLTVMSRRPNSDARAWPGVWSATAGRRNGAAERFQAAVTVAGRMPDVAGQNP